MIHTRTVLIAACVALVCLFSNSFSQVSDFNASFSYPCDDGYFTKGDSLTVFHNAGGTPIKIRKVRPVGWSKNQRLPVIVMFFGGGWGGDCAPEFKWFKNYFVGQGFVVLIAEYVLGSPIEQKAIPDGKAAIRWVRQNADTLGVDPQKIISLGSSAGGHLAAAVGTVKGYELSGENLSVSSRPNCILSLWPVMDLTKSFSNVTSVDPKLVSPAWALDDSVPPMLVMTGSNDPYMSGVQQFNTNAAAYKFEHQYKEYPNAGHDFGFRMGTTDKGNAGEDSTLAWSMAFLKKHLLLPVPVSISPRVNRDAMVFAGSAGTNNQTCYSVQGRLIGLMNIAQPSSQRFMAARKSGQGAVFSPKNGFLIIR